MSTIEEPDRGSVRRVRHAIVALLALAAGMAVFAADAAAGDLKVLKGGYRDPSSNSGSSYAHPLAGAVLEYDDSSSFGSPTDFPPTDAAGEAIAEDLPRDRYYVRERTAPAGWNPITTLVWDGATRAYVGRADVGSSGTETAEVDDLRRFVNSADNPPVPDACDVGIRILLLLDRSGSTSGFNDDYRTAANTFVDTLAGTPTSLKISSFATNSTPGTTTFDLTAPGDVTAAKAEIQSIYPTNTSGSGATNWDKALQDAAEAEVDVIVFVTDGNPTVNQGDLDSGANESIRDIAYGIASANLAKYPQRDQSLAKQRIIGVGVGGGISVPNLKAVSGPTDGEDYVVSNDPADLAEVLAKVASAICAGTLTIEKETVPASDTGKFDLEIDGTAVGGPYGNGGSTGPQTLRTGSYTVSESGAMGTDLSAYRSMIECVDDETGTTVASVKGTTVDVSIETDQEVTCTVTNTRLGTLTIEKELPIMGDPGLFDLLLDGSALVTDVGNGGTTGPQSLEPGTYTIAEVAGTDTTLDAYRTTVTCEDEKGVFIDAESATKIDVDVADGQDVVCVFENTLRGTLTAKKALVPAGDPGLFDLAIEDGDGVIASATDVGDGGSVGPVYLDGGTYVVAEAAGSGTDLAAYTSIVDCVSDVPNGMEKTIVPRQIAGPSQMVELADGENVVCTFTNTRKGTLTVEKELDPVDDPGLFDLQIDDQTLATDVGDGGTTGPQIVDAGTHTVAELAGTETDLAAYGTTVTCIDGVETLIDAAPVTSTEVAIVDGQNVTCTFTNIRKGTLTVVKNLIPASDTGTFDLQIDGTTLAAAVGDGGTTGAQIVDAGTYAVGEAGANGTLLTGYISSVACTDGVETVVTATGTSAEVPVVNGQDIVCTITNTADTGPIVPAGTPDVVPPVIVPAVTPVATVRGAARLRGPRGCIKPGRILTRVTGRNMARVVFVRNGRVVKRVKLNSTNVSTLRAVVLRTRIRPSDFRRYRVVARVTYVQGATPRSKTMTHTFRQCGRSSVTG
jgi:hypothetical protein